LNEGFVTEATLRTFHRPQLCASAESGSNLLAAPSDCVELPWEDMVRQ